MNEVNEFNQPLGKSVPNWSGAKRPEFNLLEGRLCSIEPIDPTKHARDLFDSLSFENPGDSWTYLPYGPFSNHNDFKSWLVTINAEQAIKLYAILNKNSELLGVAGYLRINPEQGSIEVGHVHYSKYLRKKPAATEAMYLLMKHVFEDLGFRRYEWKCNALNEASRSAALRLGFKFEGIFRQSNVFKGRNRDTAWFSIIDSEWSALKHKFIKWLDESNFDEKGNQRTRLNR